MPNQKLSTTTSVSASSNWALFAVNSVIGRHPRSCFSNSVPYRKSQTLRLGTERSFLNAAQQAVVTDGHLQGFRFAERFAFGARPSSSLRKGAGYRTLKRPQAAAQRQVVRRATRGAMVSDADSSTGREWGHSASLGARQVLTARESKGSQGEPVNPSRSASPRGRSSNTLYGMSTVPLSRSTVIHASSGTDSDFRVAL